jgi:thioredoxin reductase (NADPH)
MMEDFREQAIRFGTDIRFGYVSAANFTNDPYQVVIDDKKTVIADTVIISTGASAKWLGLESEAKYNGFGVSGCAVCDGYFFRGQDIALVGGGDTAAEEATYLAKLVNEVYMLVRREELRASKAMIDRVRNTHNIEILYNTEVLEVLGDGLNVTGVSLLNNRTQQQLQIPVTGLFVAIGHHPNTGIFRGMLDMDETGYIKTIPGTTATNIPGVFCAGDAQDHIYRQAITAAGTGCMAALDAERYLAAKEAARALVTKLNR